MSNTSTEHFERLANTINQLDTIQAKANKVEDFSVFTKSEIITIADLAASRACELRRQYKSDVKELLATLEKTSEIIEETDKKREELLKPISGTERKYGL